MLRTLHTQSLLKALPLQLQSLKRLQFGAEADGRMRSTIPLHIETSADGEAVIATFCRELGMGSSALQKWRSSFVTASCDETSLQKVAGDSEADRSLLHWAVHEGGSVISPFVQLSPSPLQDHSTTFVARRAIPAGVFLLSIPTSLGIEAEPPELESSEGHDIDAAELALQFLIDAEDMALSIAFELSPVAASLLGDPHKQESHGPSLNVYASYLATTVRPPTNLPFMSPSRREALCSALQADDKSVAREICEDFHVRRQGQPLNLSIFRRVILGETLFQQLSTYNETTSPQMTIEEASANPLALSSGLPPLPEDALAQYHWLLSIALSRRLGKSHLFPLLDKLNHPTDRSPNSYYTMATQETMTGLDVFDNIVAGVAPQRLYEPRVHLFALREISRGEPITISYSDLPCASCVSQGGDTLVSPAEGSALWEIIWGFQPPGGACEISERDLRAMASIVAERRIEQRKELFP